MVKKIIKNLLLLDFIRTLIVNFKLLPFKQAIKLPVLIYRPTRLKGISGRIILEAPVKFGMIKLGYTKSISCTTTSVFQCNGTMVFKGNGITARGVMLDVGTKNGILKFGEDFFINSDTYIICYKNILIGNHFRSSWNCQIIDTNLHSTCKKNKRYSIHKDIIIGNNVWLGNRSSISKGVTIADNVIISSDSVVRKSVEEKCVVVQGNPANIVAKGLYRIYDDTGEEIIYDGDDEIYVEW